MCTAAVDCTDFSSGFPPGQRRAADPQHTARVFRKAVRAPEPFDFIQGDVPDSSPTFCLQQPRPNPLPQYGFLERTSGDQDPAVTLRLLLFALFALWIPVVYWSARRFATPSLSVVVTLLAGAWSIPAYSAAMPSWFNLFFAGFAVACLLRHLETSGRRWLVAAGIAAGVSILVKVVGLYLVAGCLLALAFFEQAAPCRDPEPRGSGGRLYSGLVTAAGIALSLLVWSVVRRVAEPVVFLHFVLPAALLSGWLAVTEWRQPPSIARVRVGALAGLVLPFLVGVAMPLVVFAIPYALREGLGDLYQGVFVDPLQRLDFARRRPPQLKTMLNIVPVLAVLGMSWRLPESRRLRVAGFLALLCGLLLFLGSNWRVYPRVWFSMRSLIPVVTLCGIAVLWAAARSKGARGGVPPSHSARAPGLRELQLFTFLSVTGFAGLVQFPFTAPIYFLYVAPLVALSVLAVVAAADGTAPFEGHPIPGARAIRCPRRAADRKPNASWRDLRSR